MIFEDRLKVLSSGASAAVLTMGAAVTGCRTLAQCIADGANNPSAIKVGSQNVPFTVEEVGTNNVQTSLYTVTSNSQITLTRVLSSSNGGSAVTFSGGALTVYNSDASFALSGGLVDPFDVGYDIVLSFGQSNEAGRGTYDALIDIADPRVFQFGGTSGQTLYRTIFLGADPLHMPEKVETGLVGPASIFGRTYAASQPGNRRVLLVPAAVGGTSIVGGSPRWNAPSGDLLVNAVNQMNLAVAAAQAMYPNSRVVGFQGVIGETDGDNNVSQAAFAAGYKAMIAYMRANITGAANAWVIIGGMCPEVIASYAGYPAIAAAHQQVASEIDKCVYVPGPTGYRLDSFHYNAAGARILGARMALAVQAAKVAVATPLTAPGAVTNLVAGSATNTAVPLSWTAPATGGAASDYTIEYKRAVDSIWTTLNDGVSPATAATVPGLVINTSYNFRVTPSNGSGSGTAATVTASTTNVVSTAPAQMVAPVATAGVSSATIALTAPNDGGSAITSYSVVSNPAGGVDSGAGTTALNRTMTGLTPGQAYTFTAMATNLVGTSTASPASNSVTPTASAAVPGAPTIGTATAGDGYVDVAFTPGAANGSAITNNTATLSTGETASGTTSPIRVAAANGVARTAHVTSTNGVSTGPASAESNSVTPAAPANTYTFEGDTVGAAPANITVSAGTLVVASGITGTSGNSIHFTGGAIAGGSGVYSAKLDNVPSTTDRTITWRRSASGGTARDGMTLRATTGSVSGYSGLRRGYFFQTSGGTGALRLFRADAGGVTSIATSFALSDAARYYRASSIGTTHKFEYSADGISWSTAFSVTDATYTTGEVDYANGFDGSAPANAYVDSISWS